MRSYLMIMKFVDVVQKKKRKRNSGYPCNIVSPTYQEVNFVSDALKPKEQNNERQLKSFPSFQNVRSSTNPYRHCLLFI